MADEEEPDLQTVRVPEPFRLQVNDARSDARCGGTRGEARQAAACGTYKGLSRYSAKLLYKFCSRSTTDASAGSSGTSWIKSKYIY